MVAQKKQIQVQQLSEVLEQSPNFVLVGFEKTSHQALESLRKQLSPLQARFRVIKNTLFEKALNKLLNSKPYLIDFKKKFLPLKNPSALLTFSSEWSKGLKIFYDFIEKEKSLNFKSAILDGQIYDSSQILAIAQLPEKDQLLTQIISSLKSPLNRFIFAAKFNINKLTYILKSKGN